MKTLGTSAQQIKRLINRQPMRLSAIGIPIGLLAGFLIGKALLPILTVWISVREPAKIAGSASPIEAVRYTERDIGAFQRRNTTGKIHRRR